MPSAREELLSPTRTNPYFPRPQVDSGNAAAGAADSAPAAAEPDPTQALILDTVLAELVPHVRPEHRCAGCVWLVSLLTYCRRHPVLLARLPQLQVRGQWPWCCLPALPAYAMHLAPC